MLLSKYLSDEAKEQITTRRAVIEQLYMLKDNLRHIIEYCSIGELHSSVLRKSVLETVLLLIKQMELRPGYGSHSVTDLAGCLKHLVLSYLASMPFDNELDAVEFKVKYESIKDNVVAILAHSSHGGTDRILSSDEVLSVMWRSKFTAGGCLSPVDQVTTMPFEIDSHWELSDVDNTGFTIVETWGYGGSNVELGRYRREVGRDRHRSVSGTIYYPAVPMALYNPDSEYQRIVFNDLFRADNAGGMGVAFDDKVFHVTDVVVHFYKGIPMFFSGLVSKCEPATQPA